MKRITLIALISLSLLLVGCSLESETSPGSDSAYNDDDISMLIDENEELSNRVDELETRVDELESIVYDLQSDDENYYD